ncbi:MAG: hypothetical protein E7647_00410 [Ruminococcaceae bacterium]|nr:hypothetical protein [Oscillospiraceae bacterium]
MKTKKLTAILSIILTLSFFLSACSPTSDKKGNETEKKEETTTAPLYTSDVEIIAPEEPAEGVIKEIESDFLDYLKDNSKLYPNLEYEPYVTRYYGSYNGAIPVKIENIGIVHHTEIWEENVGGSVFRYSDGNIIRVWKDKKFYTLEKAYKKELLTQEEVYIISQLHCRQEYLDPNKVSVPNEFDKAKYAINYLPESSREEFAKALGKKASNLNFNDPFDYNTLFEDGVRCYGMFGKGAVWFVSENDKVETTVTVAGATFTHHSSFKLYCMHKDSLMSLEEALSEGYLTKEEISYAAYNHERTRIYLDYQKKYSSRYNNNTDVDKIKVDAYTAELEDQLVSDYIDFLSKKNNADYNLSIFTICRYYGNIDGMVAFCFTGSMPDWIKDTDDIIGGVIFHHMSEYHPIQIRKDGCFYYLSDAYEMGVISVEQLRTLALIHNNGKYYSESDH